MTAGMPMATDFALSAPELDFLREHLGLGRLPYPLDVPSNGVTFEERARLRAETFDGLRDKGLLHGERVEPELASLLRVLAAPEVSVDIVGFGDAPIRGVAASFGSQAALVALYDGVLSFAAVRPTSLATSIVELLPAGDAGPGHAISVPHQALQRAADGDDALFGDERDILVANGVSDKDATMLVELSERRIRGGQFGVTTTRAATRVRQGARIRSQTLITWFDTTDGRYLMVHNEGWVSLAPASTSRIAHRIDELLHST